MDQWMGMVARVAVEPWWENAEEVGGCGQRANKRHWGMDGLVDWRID